MNVGMIGIKGYIEFNWLEKEPITLEKAENYMSLVLHNKPSWGIGTRGDVWNALKSLMSPSDLLYKYFHSQGRDCFQSGIAPVRNGKIIGSAARSES